MLGDFPFGLRAVGRFAAWEVIFFAFWGRLMGAFFGFLTALCCCCGFSTAIWFWMVGVVDMVESGMAFVRGSSGEDSRVNFRFLEGLGARVGSGGLVS